jgi:hypothetical protein
VSGGGDPAADIRRSTEFCGVGPARGTQWREPKLSTILPWRSPLSASPPRSPPKKPCRADVCLSRRRSRVRVPSLPSRLFPL